MRYDLPDRAGCSGQGLTSPTELFVWFSPSFPVGGFAYSQGLETAVAYGWIKNRQSLTEWVAALLRHGGVWNDLVLIALILRAREEEIFHLCELSSALQPCRERYDEAMIQGRNFCEAYRAGWAREDSLLVRLQTLAEITLPIAVGLAARDYAIALRPTLEGYAVAWLNAQLASAMRLGVIGQFDGQAITAIMMAEIRSTVGRAAIATEEDLGTAAFGADLAAMLHETLSTRLFRS
ncbi:MAG: urease accessory protein UreF [Hyphomicrobiaceae bacterium]